MRLTCHHCEEGIRAALETHITIMEVDKDNFTVGALNFHPSCFVEIAGDEYAKELSSTPPDIDSKLVWEEEQMLRRGQKIQAIKRIRQRTGFGLKEAKDLADDYCAKYKLYR